MNFRFRNWNKTSITNMIGLVVFGFFILVIIFHLLSRAEERRNMVVETKERLNYFAEGFANGLDDVVCEFVPGETLDSWGNPIEIRNFDKKDWYLASAGPDGRFGTKDDIRNDKIVKSNVKELFIDLKSKIGKVKETIGEATEKIKSIVKE